MNRRRIRLRWTCCNDCHALHRTLIACRVHYAWLWIARRLRHVMMP